MKLKLDNDLWIRRASSAYSSAVMPEIWDDQAASGEFIDSFFDYIEFTNTSKATPLIVQSLREKAEFSPGASSTDIHDAFEDLLNDRGWSITDWKPQKSSRTAKGRFRPPRTSSP
ncbi:MAG: hypothetical protein ACJ8AT_27215 [Hyalangium sp.]|uniref:hypothetical protein n=1 Tax=Hyalangium sp. TaxID=2028555 RepID=UPI00389B155B